MYNQQRSHLLPIYLKLVLTAFFWGGTFISGKYLAQQVPSVFAASLRYLSAVAYLWVLLFFRHSEKREQPTTTPIPIPLHIHLWVIGLGLTGVYAYNICFFSALNHIDASRAALFVAFNPILVAIATVFLFKERLSLIRWCGVLIALCGAALVISRGDLFANLNQSFGIGELWMCLAVLSWVSYSLIGRKVLGYLSPLQSTTYACSWGLCLLMLHWGVEILLGRVELDLSPLLRWDILLAIIYLGIFGTAIGFIWYADGIKHIGASRTSIFTNLVPVFGVLLGVLLLGEKPLLSSILGGVLVIIGVILTNRPNTAPKEKSHPDS
jgi:drug/metabolite transporter (DMT)-like permease